jgi:hypothetical protein
MLLTQVYHGYHILSEMIECFKKWYDNRLSDIPQSKFNSCFAIVHEMNDLQIKHNVSKMIHKIYSIWQLNKESETDVIMVNSTTCNTSRYHSVHIIYTPLYGPQ